MCMCLVVSMWLCIYVSMVVYLSIYILNISMVKDDLKCMENNMMEVEETSSSKTQIIIII